MTINISEQTPKTQQTSQTQQTPESHRDPVPTVRPRRRYGELVGWIIVTMAAIGLVSNMVTNPR